MTYLGLLFVAFALWGGSHRIADEIRTGVWRVADAIKEKK